MGIDQCAHLKRPKTEAGWFPTIRVGRWFQSFKLGIWQYIMVGISTPNERFWPAKPWFRDISESMCHPGRQNSGMVISVYMQYMSWFMSEYMNQWQDVFIYIYIHTHFSNAYIYIYTCIYTPSIYIHTSISKLVYQHTGDQPTIMMGREFHGMSWWDT